MYKIFISGSIKIKKLDNTVLERIDSIMNSEHQIILGDADGVDSLVQNILNARYYKSVTVYCTGDGPRNNIGKWRVEKTLTSAKPGTRAFFTAKDIKMADDCDYGFMVWDAKSPGTLSNAIELLKRNKLSLVYINKVKEFRKIQSIEDINNLMQVMNKSDLEKVEKKIDMKSRIDNICVRQVDMFEYSF